MLSPKLEHYVLLSYGGRKNAYHCGMKYWNQTSLPFEMKRKRSPIFREGQKIYLTL